MNFGELENLNDSELFDLQNKISEIVKQRNLEKGDLEEIIDNSFNVGFPKVDGLGLNPWIENSLIICPGARIDKTKTRHICKFIVIDEEWSWESPHMISDVIRRDQSSKNFRQHSITLISPFEGMKVQVISQKSQQGKHLVEGVESFQFKNGILEKTMTKSSDQGIINYSPKFYNLIIC